MNGKRIRTLVNYRQLEEGDDDFEDFSPPVQSSLSKNKPKSKLARKSRDLETPPKGASSPKQRLSRDDKLFQKELDAVLKLSALEANISLESITDASQESSTHSPKIISSPNGFQHFETKAIIHSNNMKIDNGTPKLDENSTIHSDSDNSEVILNKKKPSHNRIIKSDSEEESDMKSVSQTNNTENVLNITKLEDFKPKGDYCDNKIRLLDKSEICNTKTETYSTNIYTNTHINTNSYINTNSEKNMNASDTNVINNTNTDYNKIVSKLIQNDDCSPIDSELSLSQDVSIGDTAPYIESNSDNGENESSDVIVPLTELPKFTSPSSKLKRKKVNFQPSDDSEDDFSGFNSEGGRSSDSDFSPSPKKKKKAKTKATKKKLKENIPCVRKSKDEKYTSKISNDYPTPRIILSKCSDNIDENENIDKKDSTLKNSTEAGSKIELDAEVNTEFKSNTSPNGEINKNKRLSENKNKRREPLTPVVSKKCIEPDIIQIDKITISKTTVSNTNKSNTSKSNLHTLLNTPKSILPTLSNPIAKSIIKSDFKSPKLSNVSSTSDHNSPFSLIKTPFRNPFGNNNSETKPNNLSVPNTGRRFGLSRKTCLKPLHPKVVDKKY